MNVSACSASASPRYHEGLFAAVAKHAKGRLQEFENFDLSQLLWSFAKARIGNTHVMVSYHIGRLR